MKNCWIEAGYFLFTCYCPSSIQLRTIWFYSCCLLSFSFSVLAEIHFWYLHGYWGSLDFRMDYSQQSRKKNLRAQLFVTSITCSWCGTCRTSANPWGRLLRNGWTKTADGPANRTTFTAHSKMSYRTPQHLLLFFCCGCMVVVTLSPSCAGTSWSLNGCHWKHCKTPYQLFHLEGQGKKNPVKCRVRAAETIIGLGML